MGEQSLGTSTAAAPFGRRVEQAIVTIKKGSHLLKCGRRGKPKFCPFRLSTDEKFLIWYSGHEEKKLTLNSVTKIIPGQNTANFQRQLQPDRESQSFSLIYANGERSLDLICKDKAQADSWFLGLKAVISRCHHARPFTITRNRRAVQSCFSSPAGYIRRKHNLGLTEDVTDFSEVRSLYGSPAQSLSERCLSDGLSYSSDSFYSSESSLQQIHNAMDFLSADSPCIQPDTLKKRGSHFPGTELQKGVTHQSIAPAPIHHSPRIEKNDFLKDIFIWGKSLASRVDRPSDHNAMQGDTLLPKLVESTIMLDVENISLGGRHAALVTKQGEVFCWGEGNGGRLGNKVNMDMSYPKIVDSLNGVRVKLVACGGYQTCALTDSGELYTWGDNVCGADLLCDKSNRTQWLPRKLYGPLDGVTISNIACGEWHAAIVSSLGQLFTYGDGTFGVLGHGDHQSLSQPKEVDSLKGLWVKSVACGSWHTAAIVEIMVDRLRYNPAGGKLFTWGDGDKGRLGHADQEKKLLPTCVASLVDYDFVQVSCGRMLTVGLTNLGKVYTMGSSVHGQLGNPQAKDKSITIVEGNLKEEFIKEISSGSYHVAVLTSKGSPYTWGKGGNGQLGLGDIEDRNSPTLVDALSDREVERIACGSSFTAAICLHKSISVGDQASCSGCRMPFGFTRKKHNCYNCGFQFCRACSGKKIINASLAPNKSKLFRVCDPCFSHLQRITNSGRLLKQESCSPRPLLTSKNVLPDEKEERGGATPTVRQLSLVRQSYNPEMATGEKLLHGKPVSSIVGMPQWGQVQCPSLFETYCNENPMALVVQKPQHSKSSVSNVVEADKGMSKQDKMLIDEIHRLRYEVKDLEKQCQIGSQKIQDCQLTIEETWSLAREEAATCKAAKEVIKALALRLHAMSEKVSARIELKDTPDGKTPHIAAVNEESLTLTAVHPITVDTRKPPEVGLSRDRQVGSLCSSPIVFSNTLKSIKSRDVNQNTRSAEELSVPRTESQEDKTKDTVHEWVEQSEPGVYITFTALPSGQKGLKRVRFSRKRFSEKEAERWWEENQVTVYEKYGIEGYNNSRQNQKA